jgi:hypothetical protein
MGTSHTDIRSPKQLENTYGKIPPEVFENVICNDTQYSQVLSE